MARLMLVHGFTQTGASWAAIADMLRSAGHEVITPDAPGHGTRGDAPANLWDGALGLSAECGPGTWVGYSMGGRLALHVALAHPDVVQRLVLVGATPGIVDDDERAARVQADEELAVSLERDGVDAFLERWLTQPLFASLPPEAADVGARRANTVAGLAGSLRLAGTGAQEPLWDRLGEIAVPVMLVVGGDDAKFRDLAFRMAERLPDATVVELGGCGHACHLETPERFVDALRDFLDDA